MRMGNSRENKHIRKKRKGDKKTQQTLTKHEKNKKTKTKENRIKKKSTTRIQQKNA